MALKLTVLFNLLRIAIYQYIIYIHIKESRKTCVLHHLELMNGCTFVNDISVFGFVSGPNNRLKH